MQKADLHTHPNLLKKPEQGEEFIRRAIEMGLDAVCFTDHMPFSVTGDEHDRIPFGGVGDYCRAVRELSERYGNEIEIFTGIEIDYHPLYEDEAKAVISSGEFDFILGSSHLNISGFGIPFGGGLTRTEYALFVLENYLAAARSGLFQILTHLDVYRWVFSENVFYPLEGEFDPSATESTLREIFAEMERRDIALEVNAAPLYKKFDGDGPYPARRILDIAGEYRIRRTYGSDAHAADKVGFGYDAIKDLLI